MPANSRSTRSSRKVSKKATKKVAKKAAKKAAKKVAKKTARKAGKKVAKKTARKAGKKVAKKAGKKVAGVPADARHEMIEKAAYYRAEKRHFQNGDPVADWLFCEKEVDVHLSKAVS